MGNVSPQQVNTNDAVVPAAINNPINTIANEFNGNIENVNIKALAGIDPSKLAGGSAGMLSAWASWTPTWVSVTVGNGTVTARYIQIGKAVFARLSFVLGSTSAVSGDVTFSLPVTAASHAGSANMTVIGEANFLDASVPRIYRGVVTYGSTTTANLRPQGADLNYSYLLTALNSTHPFGAAWTTSDEMALSFFYEAA